LISRNSVTRVVRPEIVLVIFAACVTLHVGATEERVGSQLTSKSIEPALAHENNEVREELTRMQTQEGLTIAGYDDHGLRIVNFEKRKAFRGKPIPDNRAGGGTITRDGSLIAFQLLRLGQNPSVALGMMKADNSDIREFTNVRSPGQMCWSYDLTHLAMATATQDMSSHRLAVLDIETESVQDLTAHMQRLTSQCWSPDGKEIVFESGGNVMIQNVDGGQPHVLTVGNAPTWSPEGNWIAYLDKREHSYYAIHASGEGKKKLFHSRNGVAGLYWSPDARIVAYVVEEGGLLSLEAYRLKVRRLQDNSEDWVADDAVDCCANIQWVTNKSLIARIQSETQSK
jgi:WD40 repeat protein